MSDAYFGNGGGNTTPTYQGDRAYFMREIRKLWKTIGDANNKKPIEIREIVWSLTGNAYTDPSVDNTGTFKWVAPFAGRFVSMHMTRDEVVLGGATWGVQMVQNDVSNMWNASWSGDTLGYSTRLDNAFKSEDTIQPVLTGGPVFLKNAALIFRYVPGVWPPSFSPIPE